MRRLRLDRHELAGGLGDAGLFIPIALITWPSSTGSSRRGSSGSAIGFAAGVVGLALRRGLAALRSRPALPSAG